MKILMCLGNDGAPGPKGHAGEQGKYFLLVFHSFLYSISE